MGATGSRATAGVIAEPFPVSPDLSRDLDKLSLVAARILSTSDIYDLNNLARPGICGDYMVLLKKTLEKKLLPFVAESPTGERMEIVYQNPRKTMEDQKTRQAVCKSLIETVMQTVVTVVACLASIQVASQSRETIISGVGKAPAPAPAPAARPPAPAPAAAPAAVQVGGARETIVSWLQTNGFLSAPTGTTDTYMLTAKPCSAGTTDFYPTEDVKFTVQFSQTTKNDRVTDAYIGIADKPANGFLHAQILDPIPVPVSTYGYGAPTTASPKVLPIRLLDNAGVPWLAGLLIDKAAGRGQNLFKSFNSSTRNTCFFDILNLIFNIPQKGVTIEGGVKEERGSIDTANAVFKSYLSSAPPDSSIVFGPLNDFFRSLVPNYQPVYGYGPRPGVGFGPGGPGGPADIAPAQTIIRRAEAPSAEGVVLSYDIPLSTTRRIQDTFKTFRDSLPKESSPAAVRATTLAAAENPDRTVTTFVCKDPYWTESTPARIYPWATLQYLCIEDVAGWEKLAGTDKSAITFAPEWSKFISGLTDIYNGSGVPKFAGSGSGTGSGSLLDAYRFSATADAVSICKRGGNPRVGFRAVQDGLAEIQRLYQAHVKTIWGILNELILVIVDPDTKQEVVRLHPKVTSDAKSSKNYVNAKSAEARKAITEFYLAVERTYVKTVRNLEAR